jgi:6-pyruvoyltetrahydropterin/6-carboxytetrahydropterin synthase
MYYLKKTIAIAGAHRLMPPYKGKCNNLHGHNWKITIYCRSLELNESGMIIDFSEIKRIVNILDHEEINNQISQPTAENIAYWLHARIAYCYKVDVEESEGAVTSYED